MIRLLILFVTILFTSLYGISANAASSSEDEMDSFESKDSLKPMNEKVFSFNKGVDKAVIKPVAKAYGNVPERGRTHVKNFLNNLNEPKNFVNGVLQGKPEVAFPSFWRFVVNSTFGIGGINDVATAAKLEKQDQGFSNTLGTYGVKNGDYVVLPLVGPSTERNAVGLVGDIILNPVGWVAPGIATAQVPADGITTRQEKSAMLDQLYYESMDPYASTRSAYMQNQEFKK